MLTQLFANLDRWRHLPAYQLERRADIFFSLYLKEVVEEFAETALTETIIPELPVKRDLIWPEKKSSQSVKVDYVLFAKDRSKVFFVELKTDVGSRRAAQDEYLLRSQEVGFQRILEGLKRIILATTAHQKYHHLLYVLAHEGCLALTEDLADFTFPRPRRGLKKRLEEIVVTVAPEEFEVEVIFVQPIGTDSDNFIDFHTFARAVDRHDDEVSKLFAKHLRRWVTAAGSTRP